MPSTIDYPANLPGVYVNSNGYRSKPLVARNDLASGPPIFVLEDNTPWVMFDVSFRFDALQTQVFRNWYRVSTTSGSRSFNINLVVDGEPRAHECYFDGVPSFTQSGRRFYMSATLLAIEEVGIFDAEDAASLLVLFGAFGGDLGPSIVTLADVIAYLEAEWLP
jgi:hypothetical protein